MGGWIPSSVVPFILASWVAREGSGEENKGLCVGLALSLAAGRVWTLDHVTTSPSQQRRFWSLALSTQNLFMSTKFVKIINENEVVCYFSMCSI